MATPRAAEHRDLEQRFRKVEDGVRRALSAALRRPKFEVSEGDLTINGGDLVVDGGDFLLLDTDGSTVFRLGPQTHGDRGVSLYREDGSAALSVAKTFSASDDQEIKVYDKSGNALLSEEALGSGLARPWLHIPMQPVQAASGPVNAGPYGFESVTASTSWTATHRGWYARHNQYGRFNMRVAASDATTACEVRVVNADTGTALGPFLSPDWTGARAAGSTGYVEVVSPALFLPGNPDADVSVAVEVRVTAGAGTLTVAVPKSRGGVG